jgi:hypothetical protein
MNNEVDPKYEHKVFGWNWDQWAIVFGRFEIDSVSSLSEAINIRKRWKLANPTEPGEIVLDGVDLPRNHSPVCDLFSLPLPLQHATPGAL